VSCGTFVCDKVQIRRIACEAVHWRVVIMKRLQCGEYSLLALDMLEWLESPSELVEFTVTPSTTMSNGPIPHAFSKIMPHSLNGATRSTAIPFQ